MIGYQLTINANRTPDAVAGPGRPQA